MIKDARVHVHVNGHAHAHLYQHLYRHVCVDMCVDMCLDTQVCGHVHRQVDVVRIVLMRARKWSVGYV